MSGEKKPSWVVDKERSRRAEARETVWLFGLHAVRDALMNPRREKLRLVVTKNALDKIEAAVAAGAGERDALVLETLTAFKRAGCAGVLTYHAAHAARLLNG